MKSSLLVLLFLGSSAVASTAPVILASDVGFSMSLVTDGNFVYWADSGAGDIPTGIKAVSVNGGAETLLASSPHPDVVRIDSGSLYWTDLTTGDVMVVPSTGGTPKNIASGQATPAGLVVDSGVVFWTNEGNSDVAGSIASLTLANGATASLAGDQSSPQEMLSAGNALYWSLADDGAIWSLKLDGTSKPVQLVAAAGAYAMAADATHLYWANYNTGTVNKMPLAGGVVVILGTGYELPSSMVVDDQFIYWTNLGADVNEGTVVKMDKTSGAVTVLATGLMGPDTLALDANNLYFTDGPNVYRLPKN